MPALTPETAAAQASQSSQPAATPSSPASEGASPQEVTAESLSDEELGYDVTSIPEDLDETQAAALQAFVNYDQFT